MPHRTRATGWVGWIVFGAFMLVVAGAFTIIWGLTAIFRHQVFVVGPAGNVININYTAWGWIHLIIGIIALVTGLALFNGAVWARSAAVILAFMNAVTQLLVIFSYPVWAVIIIAIDIMVIYAILAHGEEMS
ncbi:MAG TPA: hypothetical protein VFU35_06280 [Jatrophihabitans sp.]|nr:hypothetical protein [Jatrophihabitans sp.]